MTVHVEFYGIVRRRAGVAGIDVEAQTLGEVYSQLVARLPHLGEACIEKGRLKSGYLANINGRSFQSRAETSLEAGDTVLILSADVGG
ncbi:MAG: MoaD/ThiS family protein [Planctomycetaceae bacterium]